MLNFTYWHAIILTYRPFLLNEFIRLSRPLRIVEDELTQTQESVQQCLMAAMDTVDLIDKITQSRQMFRAFWVRLYSLPRKDTY